MDIRDSGLIKAQVQWRRLESMEYLQSERVGIEHIVTDERI